MLSYVLHYLLLSFAWCCAWLPENGFLYAYTIRGQDGSPYLTRILFPGWRGKRRMIHYIRRADAGRELHNHPWREARGRILLGGYLEERLEPCPDSAWRGSCYRSKWYLPGDHTELDATTFHRVARVKPRTWTTLVVGERTGDEWGFLDATDGTFYPHSEFFKRLGLRTDAKGRSV